ncbi:hypothetical protein ARSEF1564_003762 [Beauveria bassiana]
MALTTILIGLVVVTFVLRRVMESLRHAKNARELACKPPPLAPIKDPLGILSLLEMIQADKEKRVPALTEQRVNKMRDDNGGNYVTTMRLRTGAVENILTIDPKNIQAILATQFKEFCVGAQRETCMGPLLGAGIFTTDGPAWSHSRAMLRPQFTRDQISDLSLEEVHVQNAFKVMPPVNNQGWTEVDIQTVFFRLTLDSATELLFGESCKSQLVALDSANNKDKEFSARGTDFGANFDRGQWYLSQRVRTPFLKFLYNGDEFKNCCNEVHRFVDQCVERALRETSKKKLDADGKPLEGGEHYVFLHAMAAETQDPIELRAQLLNVLLAGRDTTASLLSWTVMLLARHPDKFQRLRRDIIETFGGYENPRNLTFANLKACTYLQRVMTEVLRLFPPLPMNARYATCDTSLPRGGGPDAESPVYVKKGQAVLYNAHILHRRTDIWGPDAGEFNPDRWEGRKGGWEYLPFNGGPRICIGQQFALTEAGYVLARLLQRFDGLEELNPSSKVSWGLTLVSQPGESVKVRLHEAV